MVKIGLELIAWFERSRVISGWRAHILLEFDLGNPDMARSENRNNGWRGWFSFSNEYIKVNMLRRKSMSGWV